MISRMLKKILVPAIAFFFLSIFLFGEIKEINAAVCGTNPGTCASGYWRESYTWTGTYWKWKCCHEVWKLTCGPGCCYHFPCSKNPSSIFYCPTCSWHWDCYEWKKVKECTSCVAYPPKCGTATEQYFDDWPFGTKCSVGSGSAISYNSSNWTFNWSCYAISRSCSCKAYRNAKCGSATAGEPSHGAPTDNLCSIGNPSDVIANGDLWEWECLTDESTATDNCSAARETVAPFCSLSPHNTSICEGETSTVTVDGLAPAKGSANLTKVNWNSPNSGELGSWSSTQPDIYTNITWDDGKFKFDIVGLSVSSINPINFFVNDGTGSYEAQCNTAVYIKPAGCNVSVSPSENLTVGTSVNITIMPECIEQVDSYDLDILYQGTDDPTSWWYDGTEDNFINDLNADGKVTIKIKEAGVFTFDATVEGDINGPGGTTDCNCQTTAFTSGSKWWERDTE